MTNTSSTGFIPVEGGQLAYDVTGSGPALVFIHAGVATREMWDEQVRAFSPDYTVVRYDTRGFGETKTEDVEFSNRKDLIALLDHLNIERAVVIGNSRGGTIALDTLLEFPDRFAGLVMVGSGFGGLEYNPETMSTPEELALFEQAEALQEAKDWEGLIQLEIQAWLHGVGQPSDRVGPELVALMERMGRVNYTHADEKTTPIPLDPPAFGRLGDIAVPTLVIWGDLDERTTVLMSEMMVEHIPGAQGHLFEGVAHMVSLERPEEFNQLLREFLKELGW